MIKCIKELREDADLFAYTIKRLSDSTVKRERFENNRDMSIFWELLNNEPVNCVADRYGLSSITCTNIADRFVRKYRNAFYCTPDDILNLKLSDRTYNCLKRSGIKTVQDLVGYYTKYKSFDGIRNLGKVSQDELMRTMIQYNLLSAANYREDINGLFVIYNKTTKLYKGYGNLWGSLSDAIVYKNFKYASSLCDGCGNHFEVREVDIILKRN